MIVQNDERLTPIADNSSGTPERYDLQVWVGLVDSPYHALATDADWSLLASGLTREQVQASAYAGMGERARVRVVFAGSQDWARCFEVRVSGRLDSVYYTRSDASWSADKLRWKDGVRVVAEVCEVWRVKGEMIL